MKNWKILFVIGVVLNFLIIGWLLVNQDKKQPKNFDQQIKQLVSTPTMESARYDLNAKQYNIIVISLDALRYDVTGLGGGEGHTRNLKTFAQEAVVFHNATSAAPWTLPAHMSVWTARWPSIHQVTNKLKLLASEQMVENSLSPGIATYPDLLINKGYEAVAFTGGAGVQAKYGFGRNFTTYLDDRYFGGLDYSIPAAVDWLKNNREKKFFMFLHGYDVHGQYPLADAAIKQSLTKHKTKLKGDIKENARLREQGLAAIQKPGDKPDLSRDLSKDDAAFLKQVYLSKVRDADQRLGNFLQQIRTLGLLERTIIVVMSDHGDEFMEHGAMDHGATLYEEQLHVVMMMRFPGYARQHNISEPVRTIDIFPTIFNTLGIDGISGVDGKSLLPLLRGEKMSLPIFAETDYRLYRHLRSYRKEDYKLILDLQDGEKELYHLSKDPKEQNNISSSEPRITYEMEQELRTWMNKSRTNPQDYLGVKQNPISLF